MNDAENITILTAFGDNYVYLLEYSPGKCFVVDPGDAKPVLDALEHRKLQLTHIPITHHHADHIGGIHTLKQRTGCEVIGPDDNRIGGVNRLVQDGQTIILGEMQIRCVATPGHTTTGVCYFVTGGLLKVPVLFTGDTLFVCGCGRLFECNGQTMFDSLQKLAALPDGTLIYPGHDYTEENIRFALTLEPDNKQLQKKLNEVRQQTIHNKPTAPSVLSEEKQLNPFLRAKDWQTFATLRQKKDVF